MLQVLHQPRELIFLKRGKDLSSFLNHSMPHESREKGPDDVGSEENNDSGRIEWGDPGFPGQRQLLSLPQRQVSSFQYCMHTVWGFQRGFRAYSSTAS